MSKKKSFKGFDVLLSNEEEPKEKTNSQKKTEKKEKSCTFLLSLELIDKIKFISCMKRNKVKDVFNEAIIEYINSYEKTNGTIKTPKS